ncbi:flagellar biosynthetic protein FliO [Hahella sp. NBU794]|uniref:flagellar biosynthetic protein FliO n=2 Tax=unclassified Hahella TaxID=2624107 RepID=UPI003D6EBACC
MKRTGFNLTALCVAMTTTLWLWAPGLARAAEEAAAKKPVAGVEAGQLLQVGGALVLVLALIGGAAWMMRRFTGLAPQQHQHLKMLAVLPVGTRERIALLQVGDRQIIVGITQHQITNLLTLDEPLELSPHSGEFARKLQSLLRRTENEAKGEANGAQ